MTDTSLLLETAACDGPVKFTRIVNKHFSVDLKPDTEEGAETGRGDILQSSKMSVLLRKISASQNCFFFRFF